MVAITHPKDVLARLTLLRNTTVDLSLLPARSEFADQLPPVRYDPLEVIDQCEELLSSHASLINEVERYNLYDQIFVAALECGKLELADKFKGLLIAKFNPSTSIRAKRIVALFHEANEEWDEAEKIYSDILTADDTNTVVWKRLASVYRSKGNRGQAIQHLVSYLDTFTTDLEAWSELSNIYITEGMYQQASFCIEELLMQREANHLLHVRYADLQFTLGHNDIALKYYCSALELCPDLVRALYGIRLCCSLLLDSDIKNKKPQVKPTTTALNELAKERLLALYNDSSISPKIQQIIKKWCN